MDALAKIEWNRRINRCRIEKWADVGIICKGIAHDITSYINLHDLMEIAL
jgi:hypothetical protein